MPDITMCLNEDCIKNKKCYRYIAIPSDLQSYSIFEPICNEEKGFKCNHFWSTEKVNNHE